MTVNKPRKLEADRVSVEKKGFHKDLDQIQSAEN